MATEILTIKVCDVPGCDARGEVETVDITRESVTVSIDLCAAHVVPLADLLPYGRRNRRRVRSGAAILKEQAEAARRAKKSSSSPRKAAASA